MVDKRTKTAPNNYYIKCLCLDLEKQERWSNKWPVVLPVPPRDPAPPHKSPFVLRRHQNLLFAPASCRAPRPEGWWRWAVKGRQSRIVRFTAKLSLLPQVLHRLQNKEKPMQTTFTLRFGSLKMIFECSIARCDVGLGRAIVQCQKNPLRKPKLSINRAILSAHFSAVKFCIGFFCWIGFFWFCIGFFCNWMLQLLLKIVATNLNYASLHVCT